VIALLLTASLAFASDWEFISDKDGVQTYKSEVEGSPLLGFRGVATLDVHISKLLGLILDDDKCTDWIDLLTECSVPRRLADNVDLTYQRYDLAWPISDRDYSVRRSVELDLAKSEVTILFESVEHDAIPEYEGNIRATVMRTRWKMSVVEGDKTHIDSEVFTDPKGAIPAWLVNRVQGGWARKSILALEEGAQKPDVKPYADIATW